jgi:hypothetical protein
MTDNFVQSLISELNIKKDNIYFFQSPSVVTVHVGYGVISVSLAPILK